MRNRGPAQMGELVATGLVLIVGLTVFAFRRWHESETEVSIQRQVAQALALLHEELDGLVRHRTDELRTANLALREEAKERGRATDALRLQGAALTAAANAILITDRAGAVVWANPAFTTLTGYILDEVFGRNPREFIKSGRQDPAIYRQMWETILAGRTWQGELFNRRKEGTVYLEEQTITPVRSDSGEITHFIAIKQDQTQRMRFESELRRFRVLIDRSDVAIEVIDPITARILDVNESACRELG
jgi:PAS domain S-box-containing protein